MVGSQTENNRRQTEVELVLKMKSKRDGIKIVLKINGGKIINKVVSPTELKELLAKIEGYKSIFPADGIA